MNGWLADISNNKNKNNTYNNNEESNSDSCKGRCIEEPPDGGVRAWCVVASCSVINILIGILEPAVGFALFRSEDDTGLDENTLSDIYNMYISVTSVYAPIAFISMSLLGCKWTIHIGSWALAVSFLILSFVTNEHAIKFLLYGIAGIGSSLVQLGTLIPILEYFTSKRIRALAITKVSKYCGQIITLIIVLSGAKPTWKSIYRICMGLSIPIGFIGLTIPTLKSRQGTNASSFVDKTLLDVHLKVLKNGHLWLVCALFFVYQLGVRPQQAVIIDGQMSERLDIESEAEDIVYGLSTGVGLIIGAILGWIFKFSASRKFYGCIKQIPTSHELFNVLLVLMVGIPVFTAIMCFIAHEALHFSYFLIFTVLFSAQLVFIEELRDDLLPDVFGQANVKLVEGLVHMFIGIGAVIASTSAAELNWKNSFRMGGGLLLVTSAVAVGILLLRLDVKSKIVKVNPIITENTEKSCRELEPSSSSNQSATSEDNISSTSVEVTEVAQIPTNLDVLENYGLKYKSKTTYGPSNRKFVIPRKNRMYGSREGSVTSSEGSDDSVSPDFNHLQDAVTNATRRTVYTDFKASRSPDSYGIIESNRNRNKDISTTEVTTIKPPQYNVLYSYNITQTMHDDMNNIDLL